MKNKHIFLIVVFAFLIAVAGCNIPQVQQNLPITEENIAVTIVPTVTQSENQNNNQQSLNIDKRVTVIPSEPENIPSIVPSGDVLELADVSFAEINLMSDNKLISYYSQVMDEMTGRNILHEHFNYGEYIAGRDIKPGMYTVSVIKNYDTDSHSAKVCYLDEESGIENHWLINQQLYFKDVGEKGSFSIESNELLEIYGCELEIIEYKPFLQ